MASVPCPDAATVVAFVEHTLSGAERAAVESHVFECESCREAIAHAVAATDANRPRSIGRYRLEHVIGRGGMGVVWRAWDPALERPLAIKLLRSEIADGAARLLREARALAKLQHPHVIAVHDVGEATNGDVFIATELISGEPLSQWQRGRPVPAILDAYAQAARGLAAAHALGIVHRDVKPSNIFVGDDGRVRVGDFGLATWEREVVPSGEGDSKTPANADVTRSGQIVGTPAYMAPEQRAGKPVDARADQFSLCLALVEALTGTRPEASTAAPELSRSNVAAPWTVIARGLAIDPAARHRDLAPIIAALAPRPARRWPYVAFSVAVAGAIGGAVLLRAGGGDACNARPPAIAVDRAALISAFHATKLAYADDAAARTLAGLDAFAARFAAEDREACHAHAERRSLCLGHVRDQANALVAAISAQPDPLTIQRAAASVRGLPDPDLCAAPAALAEQAFPAEPARANAIDAAVAHAAALRRLGKLSDARTAVDAALGDARAANYLPAIAEALHERGTILHAQGNAGAEQSLVDALAAAAAAHADLEAARIAALLVEVVGDKRTTGDPAAAERQASLARAAIVRAGGDRYLDGVVERGLGHTDQQAQHYATALAHYQRAEELHRAIGALDDVDFDRRAEVMALGSLDRIDDATRVSDAVLASDRANLGPKHPKTISDISNQGVLLFKAGRFAAAATTLEAALALDEEVFGKASVQAAQLRAQLGGAYLALGRLAEAEPMFRDAVSVLAATRPAADPELRGERMNLAAIRILLGNYRDAEADLIALGEAARAAGVRESLGLVLQNLGDAYVRDGKPALALAAARDALAADAPGSLRAAEAHVTLGSAQLALGKRAGAIGEYETAIRMFETVAGKDTAELGEPLTALGELRGDRAMLARAIGLLAGGDPVDLARARLALGTLTGSRADVAAADVLLRAAGPRAALRRTAVEAWLAAHP